MSLFLPDAIQTLRRTLDAAGPETPRQRRRRLAAQRHERRLTRSAK